MKHLFFIFFLFLGILYAPAQTWVIDAGHGGHDGGCEGAKSCEKNINLKVATELVRIIKANMKDINVVMTRDKDVFVTLGNRCRIANNLKADLFLSIHVNASPDNNTVRGTETYFGPLGGTANVSLEDARKKNINKSELLARLIQRHYSVYGRPSIRGVKQERYWVVLHTMMPSVLTEIGFISTPQEEEYLNSTEGIHQTALSIYNALKDYRRILKSNTVSSSLAELKQHPIVNTPTNDLAYNGNTAVTPQASISVTPIVSPKPVQTNTEQHAQKQTPKQQNNTSLKKETSNSGKQNGANNYVIEFCVQICSLKSPMSENDPRLKDFKPLRVVRVGDTYKYYYGSTPDYEVAKTLKTKADKIFKGAFLVSFKNGTQISVADAKEMYMDYLKR